MRYFLILFSLLFLFSCGEKTSSSEQKTAETRISIPVFNADSAFYFIEKQVLFGPRIPNTEAHRKCGDYVVQTFSLYGADVVEQSMQLKAWNGEMLNARNIIASFQPENRNRILLFAHWDTRPYSDYDIQENWHKPIDGANDGASGVGVLMEIARHISLNQPEIGVDIILFDAEDYGLPAFAAPTANSENTWCLGSQYWSKNPHVPTYQARYGILLDMVGAANATFPKEQYSLMYAEDIVTKVWTEAEILGFSNYFPNKKLGFIIDDHLPVNRIAGIPSIDIIHYTEHGFGDFWHTQQDNLSIIDKGTLKVVGQTLLSIIYKEK